MAHKVGTLAIRKPRFRVRIVPCGAPPFMPSLPPRYRRFRPPSDRSRMCPRAYRLNVCKLANGPIGEFRVFGIWAPHPVPNCAESTRPRNYWSSRTVRGSKPRVIHLNWLNRLDVLLSLAATAKQRQRTENRKSRGEIV